MRGQEIRKNKFEDERIHRKKAVKMQQKTRT